MTALLSLAIRAALDAGSDIMAIYNDPTADFGIERKADNSPLTRADKAAHARITSLLEPTGIPVLSEEGAHLPFEVRRTWQRLWIVDPLDGTKEFIKRNGEFTVNIALVENGTPILGVIYKPAPNQENEAGTLFFGHMRPEPHAWKVVVHEKEGLTNLLKDAQPLPVLPATNRPYICVASRSHLSPETETFIDELRKEHPDLQLSSSGSSLKICLVAEGKADIYPRFAPTMEWDTAAGHAIALAAGHSMVDAQTGKPLTYNKADLHNPWFIVQ